MNSQTTHPAALRPQILMPLNVPQRPMQHLQTAFLVIVTLAIIAYLWRISCTEGFLWGPNAKNAPHEHQLDTDSQHADYIESKQTAKSVLFAESLGNVMNRTGESNALGVETFTAQVPEYEVYDAVSSNQEQLRHLDAPPTLGPVRQKEVLPPLGPGGIAIWGSTTNMGSANTAERSKPQMRVAQVHRVGNTVTETTADGRKPDIPLGPMGPFTDANYAGGPLLKGLVGGVSAYLYDQTDEAHAPEWGSPGGGYYVHNSKTFSNDTNRIQGAGFNLLGMRAGRSDSHLT